MTRTRNERGACLFRPVDLPQVVENHLPPPLHIPQRAPHPHPLHSPRLRRYVLVVFLFTLTALTVRAAVRCCPWVRAQPADQLRVRASVLYQQADHQVRWHNKSDTGGVGEGQRNTGGGRRCGTRVIRLAGNTAQNLKSLNTALPRHGLCARMAPTSGSAPLRIP